MSRCKARVRRYTGKRFPQSTQCSKPRREGMVTCWSHRHQENQLAERCQLCGLNPEAPENKGRQLYRCDKCRALVCSDCSEDAEPKHFPGAINPVVCQPCHRELKELDAEQAGLR